MPIRKWLRLDTKDGRYAWDERIAMFVGGFIVLLVALALVGSLVMSVQIYRHGQVQGTGNPLEPIFASRLMIAASRFAIIATGMFVVVSVLVHMRRGQWLSAVGPFRVQQSLRTLRTQIIEARDDARVQREENEQMRRLVAKLSGDLTSTKDLLTETRKELAERG